MTNFKIFLFIFFNFIVIHAKISDYRKCANKDCTELISTAKVILRYTGDDSRILSLTPHAEVKIFSKEAGSRSDLWGAEVNGKRGYIPKTFVRETKVFKKDLKFLEPTEGEDDPYLKPVPAISKKNPSQEYVTEIPVHNISPNTVKPAYEVIDGTTIYLPPGENSSSDYVSTPSSNQETKNLATDVDVKPEIVTSGSELENSQKKKSEEIQPNQDILKQVVENAIKKDSKQAEENAIKKEDVTQVEVKVKKKEDVEQVEEDLINKEDVKQVEKNARKREDEKQIEENVEQKESDFEEENENVAEAEEEDEEVDVENENEYEYDETVETSSEVPDSVESLEENPENVQADENIELDIKENNENGSEKPVQEDIRMDVKDEKLEQINETKSNLDEKKSENLNENKLENLDVQKEEVIINKVENLNGVPFKVPNPLHFFRQPVEKPKVETEIKVPENETQPSSPESEAVPTNSSIINNNLPLIELPETSTQSDVLNEHIQPDTSAKKEEIEQIPTTESSIIDNNLPLNDFPESTQSGVSNEQAPPVKEEVIEQIPTTQSSISDSNLPLSENHETFTPNPILDEEIESNSAEKDEQVISEFIEPKIEELKAKNDEIDTQNPNESVEEIGNESEEIVEKEIYDKNQEPTFIDNVAPEHSSLIANEISQNNNLNDNIENVSDSFEENEEPGFFSKIYSSLFGSDEELKTPEVSEKTEEVKNSFESTWKSHLHEKPIDKYLSSENENQQSGMESCASNDNPASCAVENQNGNIQNEIWPFEVPENAYSIFLYLSLTAITVLLFCLGFYYIEKKRKDGSYIASINTLEKKLLVSTKECLLLHDELKTTKERLSSIEDSSFGSNEMVTSLKAELEEARTTRIELEEQVSNLEKELENATEAGMELNRMLREILTSQSGNEHLMQNVEQLQKQLNEQQETINSMKIILGAKNTENELLQTELSVANEKNIQLQDELNKMVVNLLSAQEEKNNIENKLEKQNEELKSEYEATIKQINNELNILKEDNKKLKQTIEDTERVLNLKNNEYDLLKQGMKEIQTAQSNKDSIMALLDVSRVKAEVQQLRDEKHKMADKLQKEVEEKYMFEKEVQVMIQEVKILKDKFDEAEKEKVEAQTRLEVLSAYFKEKEAQLQKEINENESKFMQKEGEATSTIERIKWIQEELQNYKAQNELLKKEILDQEVSLKSQISMLEKKSHDNWLLARQAERRVEESKQEASQLRNRLTIVEKNLNNSTHINDESKLSNRIMSPLESNGELPVSPLHMSQVDAPGSPPLLFPHRDHMTTSPPLPGLPPFMPPPPGVPFMPPPMPGHPPFMPPPPALFPGDHRPPPLGRMSSPPLRGRYSPDSRAYSPYDRDDSPPLSPTYPDSDYRRRSPPPPNRIYSPYSGSKPTRHWERDDDREYRGQQRKPRTHKGLSSGSGNSNESLDNSGRHSGRV